MPHPLIEISELTQVIADHCLLLGDERSLVSLACTCRALEEQALSTLWSEQSSLVTLIKSTLPPGTLSPYKPLPQPTNAELERLRRYASWMRRLVLDWDSGITEDVFDLVSLGLSGGILCPGLRELHWEADSYTLPFYQLLLSPKLTTLSLIYSSFRGPPEEEFSKIQPVIMGLDTSSLKDLYLQWCIPEEANRQMEPVASSVVLRCGPALEKLAIFSPLSDAAVLHIMQLPNLVTWFTMNGPPRTPDSSPSDIFPQLDHLSLAGEGSLEWLTLFARTARGIPSTHNSHSSPNRGPVQTLGGLATFPRVPVDAAFMSPIMLFRELIFLRLSSACSIMGGCTFRLTDDDVAEIAAALPRLGDALFGTVCSANSCRTTVASLVSLSTRCRDLERLEIHFSTKNLRHNLESASTDPRLDSLTSLRMRDTFHLSISDAPYTISEDDVVPVLKGFRGVFPSLAQIDGNSTYWEGLSLRLREV
ncbi:hypothetical protein BJ322DRAFT_279206 [Thelephora terrestris]|uniref:F-box domain-containing protein n=1 Tax=Thelephora terrestris TaxID=56493 RepID=A0A9P6H6U0_9AGAM|nr:hypothetical protein BJ322DRAFT_279206 [Thelephora terrestris]